MQLFLPHTRLYKSEYATTLGVIFFIILLSTVVFFDTWSSLVNIWIRSETFTHGFFVMPASFWLIWQNKAIHPYLYPNQPSYVGLAFILLNGLIWLLAAIIQTQVIQQYALIGILIGSFWFYLGNKAIKKIIFPLSFLYFMVPVGEALLPYLMEYTASFTIGMLRLTGISVYREGLHFSLVSGNWSVVEACGGLRYLLSTITLGVIYSYITFTKTHKRIIFILFSIVLPIIANGFRAYMIVMIGHLSNMTLAVGVDHLIYGAIFYAIIIFFMFFVGSFWKDPTPQQIIPSSNIASPVIKYNIQQNSVIALILILCLAFWPLSNNQLESRYQANPSIPEWPSLSQGINWKTIKAPSWDWQPKIEHAANESIKYFKTQDISLALYQANFGDEKQGAELVNTRNKLLHPTIHNQWYIIEQSSIQGSTTDSLISKVTIRNIIMNKNMTTLGWYQIGSYSTNNIYMAKLYQLYKRLTLNTAPETYNIIFFEGDMPSTIELIKDEVL